MGLASEGAVACGARRRRQALVNLVGSGRPEAAELLRGSNASAAPESFFSSTARAKSINIALGIYHMQRIKDILIYRLSSIDDK